MKTYVHFIYHRDRLVVSDVYRHDVFADTIDRNKISLFSGTKPSLQHNLMLEPVPDLLTDTTPTSRCVCVCVC